MVSYSFQESSVINIKVLATFYKNLSFDIMKTKTIFVNPDEYQH